ncbi:MAG: RHS repeat domain-containing protein, partial [Pyrinomonadaceae bacterium]
LGGAVDPFGRPGTTHSPTNQTVKIYYEDAARITKTESDLRVSGDALLKTRETHDQLGRTILSERNENGSSNYSIFVQTAYNTPARTVSATNPYRSGDTVYWSQTTSDTLGRMVSAQGPDGSMVTTAYDANRTLVTDQAGKKRLSVVNAIGQLKEVWEITPTDQWTQAVSFPGQNFSTGYKTSYGYDPLSNLTSVTQGDQTRSFSYSSLSRLTSAYNPESGTINYQYDNNGNLRSKTDARGVLTTYVYDALNRLTSRSYSGGGITTPNVTYTYENPAISNSKGRLTKVHSDVSTTEYTQFDILGRVKASKQKTDGVEYGGSGSPCAMTYNYNVSGALVNQQYPSCRIVENTINTTGNLSEVKTSKTGGALSSYASSFIYSAAGAVTSMKLGNNLWESTVFNSRLQPEQIALGTTQNATNKLKLNYTYGGSQNNGNVMSQTITVPGLGQPFIQNYTYDELNRLKTATETNNGSQTWTQVFGYDRYGNRNITSGLGVTNLSFSGNRITAHSYDLVGNTTADGTGKTFTYDAENKQKTAVVGGYTNEYFYDGDGRRVKKYVPSTGETTIFVYDAMGKQIAEYSTVVAAVQDAKVAYLTADHLGSPRINTDATGTVTARHDYHPFGEEIYTAQRSGYGGDAVRKQFTGYERDAESGLDFAEARYYSNVLGRFSSADHFANDSSVTNPQSWNLYVYVRNNPQAYVDRNGKELFVVVNGKAHKVVAAGRAFFLETTDGTNSLVRDSEGLINRLAEKFDREISNLINGKQYSTISVDRETGRPNLKTIANHTPDGVSSTTGGVGISGNDDASLLSLGTEILVAEALLTSSPYVQTSQDPKGAARTLAMSSGGGVDNAMLGSERLRQNMEDRVRAAFGMEGIDRGRTRFDVFFNTEPTQDSGQGSGRGAGTGSGGLSTGLPQSPVVENIPEPPPPLRPRPKPTPNL